MSDNLIGALDRFLEAASVAEKWRALAREERTLIGALGKAFRVQGQTFIRGLSAIRYKFAESQRSEPLQEAFTVDDWLHIFDLATRQTNVLFFDPLQDGIAAALTSGGMQMLSLVGFDMAFSLKHPRATVYLQSHGSTLISQINELTRGNIQTILSEGIDQGWGYNRIAEAITDMYSAMAVGKPQQHIDSRAHLIAVTELGNAYEEGSQIVVRDLQDGGLQMEKSWLTVGDDRVSEGCKANQGEGWIPFATPFLSGHQRPLRFPGCRCTALYRRKPNAQQ